MPELPDAAREVIQGLWIGGALTPLEQLSIRSFLAHGHPYHLYVYDRVEGVPPGTVVRDAAEILPPDEPGRHRWLSGFSNFFRYKLLLERGGWWSDLDAVCLRPFRFHSEHVFSSEHRSSEDMTEVVNTGHIRAPAGSAAMELAWSKCHRIDLATVTWGGSGPRLMQEVVAELGMAGCARPARTFCPVPYYLWFDVVTPGRPWDHLDDGVYAVHLWNSLWQRHEIDKCASFAPNCLFERLKREYGVATASA